MKDKGLPKVRVSYGEVIDKHTIQIIKMINAPNEEVENLLTPELKYLRNLSWELRDKLPADKKNDLSFLKSELVRVNSSLWSIEDKLRVLEKEKTFNNSFISLARQVYRTNDERSRIKSKINELFKSEFEEVKIFSTSYE